MAELALPVLGHLLPVGHPDRHDPAFIVAACRFCNEASNRTKWDVERKSPEELVAQKLPVVLAVRERYKEFWEAEVRPRVGAPQVGAQLDGS